MDPLLKIFPCDPARVEIYTLLGDGMLYEYGSNIHV